MSTRSGTSPHATASACSAVSASSVRYATMGTIGFEGKSDYGAIGPVVHASARLCEAAEVNQILIGQRSYGAAREGLAATDLGELVLPGATREQGLCDRRAGSQGVGYGNSAPCRRRGRTDKPGT